MLSADLTETVKTLVTPTVTTARGQEVRDVGSPSSSLMVLADTLRNSKMLLQESIVQVPPPLITEGSDDEKTQR